SAADDLRSRLMKDDTADGNFFYREGAARFVDREAHKVFGIGWNHLVRANELIIATGASPWGTVLRWQSRSSGECCSPRTCVRGCPEFSNSSLGDRHDRGDLGDFFAKVALDAHLQSHRAARTAVAGAVKTDLHHARAGDINQLDV